MLFTKETCLNSPSDKDTTICHLSLSMFSSLILMIYSVPEKYISTYLRKEFIYSCFSFKNTLTVERRPAKS